MRIVLDTDVAICAAGPPSSGRPEGERCRRFMALLLSCNHRLMRGQRLLEEWKRHFPDRGASTAARTFIFGWLTTMEKFGRVDFFNDSACQELTDAIDESFNDAGQRDASHKDSHLVQLAMDWSGWIASKDQGSRSRFRLVARSYDKIRSIPWLNPGEHDEGHGPQLQDGTAACVRQWQLGVDSSF